MTSSMDVIVQDLAGEELQLEMGASENIASLRKAISVAWNMDLWSFRLLAGSEALGEKTVIESVALAQGSPLVVQLVKYDLLELGQFVQSDHSDIEIKSLNGKDSTVVKTSHTRDSNNVFLRHLIHEPCFAEFHVIRCADEMSFGVTYDIEQVEPNSGYSNLYLKTTWIYSRKKSMPVLFFGGGQLDLEGDSGVRQGDRVAVYADPQERLVKFYRNGELMASNLPHSPLPESERPLRMYAMVDQPNDEISVIRFGPGEPY